MAMGQHQVSPNIDGCSAGCQGLDRHMAYGPMGVLSICLSSLQRSYSHANHEWLITINAYGSVPFARIKHWGNHSSHKMIRRFGYVTLPAWQLRSKVLPEVTSAGREELRTYNGMVDTMSLNYVWWSISCYQWCKTTLWLPNDSDDRSFKLRRQH